MSAPPQGYAYDAQGQVLQPQGGQHPAPAPGQYPPPQGGQYPPPAAGQYPPPGQYPQPHGGQYPPPGMQPQPGYGPPAGYPQPQPGMYPAPAPGAAPGGPRAPQFMQAPAPMADVPPGLEYLAQINQLLVHQQVEIFELFTGFETCNKYQVKNIMGQQVYFAGEESDACMRQCCGPSRSFIMHITDNFGREVIRVSRDFKCCAGCNCCAFSDCCAMEVRVEAPVGQVIGFIQQQQSCIAPQYAVLDAHRDKVMIIQGPACMCQGPCCAADVEFKVQSTDGVHELGKISKQWSGMLKEHFTDADNFGVTFPVDLDVRVKATLLGAVFLIDFMFFEQKQNNDNRHH